MNINQHCEPLVSAQWLFNHLHDPNVIVLDAGL